MTNTAPTATYDPTSPASRRALATAILECLAGMKASERPNIPSGQERQIARRIRLKDGSFSRNLQVVVYTTIVGDAVRDVGKDAIRVALLYKCKPSAEHPQGRVIGIGSETRVNRVGRICDIVSRMCERWDNIEKSIDTLDCCHSCGAPRIMSKRTKNMYCADMCWLDKST